MQIPYFRVAFSVCFLAIFQILVTSSDNVVEPEEGSASVTTDQNQYANAYQVYQQWAQHQHQHPIHHKPPITNPFKVLKNRQDSLADDIEAIFGPDAGITLGALGAIMGTFAAVAVTLNTFSTSSICSTTKALGDTSLTSTSTSNMAALDPGTATSPTDAEFTAYNALIIARFNLIENAINGYATPSC